MGRETFFSLRAARLEDIPSVEEYYRDIKRPPTVFPRTKEALEKSVARGLFLLLEDDGQIIAAGGVHPIKIETFIGNNEVGKLSVPFTFGEIGSIWRRVPHEKAQGYMRELIYSACAMLALQSEKISALVTQIVAAETKSIEKLKRLNMGWSDFRPSPVFCEKFKKSIADEQSKTIELRTFIATPRDAVLEAASCLTGQEGTKFSTHEMFTNSIKVRGEGGAIIHFRTPEILKTASFVWAAREAIQNMGRDASWVDVREEVSSLRNGSEFHGATIIPAPTNGNGHTNGKGAQTLAFG